MHPENRTVDELAYQLWQARGCPVGTAEQDWLDAERQLRSATRTTQAATSKAVDDSLKDTFPASDPPSSHMPDKPPANADAKFKAAGVSRKNSVRRKPAPSKSPSK
jgi:hypothetical protein